MPPGTSPDNAAMDSQGRKGIAKLLAFRPDARCRRMLFYTFIGILLMLLLLPGSRRSGADPSIGGESEQPVRVPNDHASAAELDGALAL